MTPSPTSATAMNTGCVTSCLPRRLGVIIAPQKLGAVFAIIDPLS
ncbi:MAG: hypothetical protein OSA51_02875 [Octadecabacter sp.]|nr:hypothetical protein [Octadecabacter sp.]